MFTDQAMDLEGLLDLLSEGVLFLDEQGHPTANRRFRELMGIAEDEQGALMKTLAEHHFLEDAEEGRSGRKSLSIFGKALSVEYRTAMSESGSRFWTLAVREEEKESPPREIDVIADSLETLKDILDSEYQAYVLVDDQARIVKWHYERLLGIKEEDVLGKPVEEVLENTRLHVVVRTGKKEMFTTQRIRGNDMIGRRYPIFHAGRLIGAMGVVMFKNLQEYQDAFMKIKQLSSTIDSYKNEISSTYRAHYTFEDIITCDEAMKGWIATGQKAALSSSTVLIRGESGTGKEYFAHAIHSLSRRRDQPFIRINCAAIPQELLESELFGYEGGAFTGAKKGGKIGKLELANGGTVLLDEIGSMPYAMQSKLLRVLEEREIEKIGGKERIGIDIRVIASTNENLADLVKKGLFRKDLYYRLNVVDIALPPLRDRREDIPLLCKDILERQVQGVGPLFKTITPRAIADLEQYDWPGNVRELRNVLERAANVTIDGIIDVSDLPETISAGNQSRKQLENRLLSDIVAQAEITAIRDAVQAAGGNRSLAAEHLGIHRTALYKKLKSYGIDCRKI